MTCFSSNAQGCAVGACVVHVRACNKKADTSPPPAPLIPPWLCPQAFYFRASYLLLCVLCAVLLLMRSFSSMLALASLTLAGLCGNDSFVGSFNDKLLRLVRRIHPPSALKLRARASAAQPEGSLGWVHERGSGWEYACMRGSGAVQG